MSATNPPAADWRTDYTVFDLASGEVAFTGTCEGHAVSQVAPDGRTAVQGRYSTETHCWKDGALYAYSEAEIAQKAARPDFAIRWDNTTMTWLAEPPAAVLAALKQAKWASIKDARHAAEFGLFAVGDLVFDGDENSQRRIQGAVQLATLALAAQEPFVIEWTLADNSTATLTAQQVLDVGRALAGKIQMVYAHARGLRQRIAQAATAEEIAAITWA